MKNDRCKMKMTPLFIAFFLLTSQARAQDMFRIKVADSLIKAHQVAILTIHETVLLKRKKSQTSKKIYHFDREGRTTFHYQIDDTLKQKRIAYSSAYSYASSDEKTSLSAFSWGRYPQTKISSYDQNGRLIENAYFNHKGKAGSSYQLIYTDSLLSRKNSYDRKHRLSTYYLYTYQGSKLKSSALYSAKGKLIRFWDYQCDESGSITKPSKDSVKICKEKTYLPDGGHIETMTSFNFKGEPVKYVEYFDSNKRLNKYLIYNGKEQILTFKYLLTYSGARLATAYKWASDSKGQVFSVNHYTYDQNGQITQAIDSLFYKPKQPEVSLYTYTFNEKGLPISKRGYRGEKLFFEERYRYTYYIKDH